MKNFLRLILFLFSIVACKPNGVPARSVWKVATSTIQEERFNGIKAIDGDLSTRWSSNWLDDQWLIIDTSQDFLCTGLRIYWESAYAKSYSISTSLDKENWTKLYETNEGEGDIQDVFIKPIKTKYIKLNLHTRATGWGFSIKDIELKGNSDIPIIKENGIHIKESISLLDGNETTVWKSNNKNKSELFIDLIHPTEIGGVFLKWGNNYAKELQYYTSLDGENWHKSSEIKEGLGNFEILKHKKKKVKFLKLVMWSPNIGDTPIAIQDIMLYGPNKEISKLSKLETLAKKMPLGLYPPQLRNRQVYWTLLGVPNDTEETLFDEYGNIEPSNGKPLLMPVLKVNEKLLTAFDALDVKHKLAEGYLPIPSVQWIFKDFEFTINGIAYGSAQNSISEVSYSIKNKTSKKINATLFFVVLPVQINPKWQHGGLSLIEKLEIKNKKAVTSIEVNNEELYRFSKKAIRAGGTSFNNETVIQQIFKNKFPHNKSIKSKEGLISGVLEYGLPLTSKEEKSIRVIMPLHKNSNTINFNEKFSKRRNKEIKNWKNKLDRVGFTLGDKEVENTVKSQLGYILLNQDGIVIQPGSRNYNRTWIRDGAMTCSALMRLGLLDEAKNYMEWYAQRIRKNGQVPPILLNTGEDFKGYGADIEWDAQGEFIYGMMEYYRFTKDKKFLKKHFNTIHSAMQYMVELRNVTLQDDYMKDEKENQRFKGILPESISHEGYDIPRHSYWDDFWAIRGWIDGEYAAKELHKNDISKWAQTEHRKLATDLKKSIELTIQHFNIDYIPSSADLGDPDPTSVAIGLFPCESTTVLPKKLLLNTFKTYINSVKDRVSNGKTYSYTPYENRNILALAKLGMKKEAQELHKILFKDKRPSAWNNWAEVVHSRETLGSYIGDMPHTWVGSGYLNSVRGLIILEDDVNKRIELLNGAPLKWLQNDGISLINFPTHFGNATINMVFKNKKLTLTIDGDFEGLNEIKLFWPTKDKPTSLLIDGVKIKEYYKDGILFSPSTKKIIAKW